MTCIKSNHERMTLLINSLHEVHHDIQDDLERLITASTKLLTVLDEHAPVSFGEAEDELRELLEKN